MKKILIALLSILSYTGYSQETTVETLAMVKQPVDTIYCQGDTITQIYLRVLKTTTENGTPYPNVRIDSLLYMNGICPADSIETLRQEYRDATELQNKAHFAANKAFQDIRRSTPLYITYRSLITGFSGVDLYILNENNWYSSWEGTYRINDIEAGTFVICTLKRLGPDLRYRLEIDPGYPGAGTRYTMIPFTNGKSFRINQYPTATLPAANYDMFLDEGVDSRSPVYRAASYLTGDSKIRIVKIR